MQPPGTEDSAFFAFAVLDELIRTLVDKGVLAKADAIGVLDRTIVSLKNVPRGQVTNCVKLAKEMIGEYSK